MADDDYDYDYEKLFLRPLDAVARGQKCPGRGRQVVEKGQNHVHVVIE